MKKILLTVLVIAIGLGLMTGTALAGTPSSGRPPAASGNTPYMTLDQNAAQKTSFGWNEQPFLYLWLPIVNNTLTLNVTNIWKHGNTVVDTQNLSYPNVASLQNWQSLSNWTSVQQLGDWTVQTSWGYAGSRYQTCVTRNFTVTPEPVSAALFLIGGLALTTRKFFNKKR